MTTYYAKDDQGNVWDTFTARKDEAIAQVKRDIAEWSGGLLATSWHEIAFALADEEPDPYSDEWEYETITVEANEPECTDSAGHNWESPWEIVGGIKENPGVWGHGGGVTIREVCRKCGCGKLTDTWAQDPVTGRQGLRAVSYDENYLYSIED